MAGKKTSLKVYDAADLDNMAAVFLSNASKIADSIRRGDTASASMAFALSKFDGRPGTPLSIKVTGAAAIRDGVQLSDGDTMTVADAHERVARWIAASKSSAA